MQLQAVTGKGKVANPTGAVALIGLCLGDNTDNSGLLYFVYLEQAYRPYNFSVLLKHATYM